LCSIGCSSFSITEGSIAADVKALRSTVLDGDVDRERSEGDPIEEEIVPEPTVTLPATVAAA